MTRLLLSKPAIAGILVAASFNLTACSQNKASPPDATAAKSQLNHTISATDGTALGTLLLEDLGAKGTKITVTVDGISPGLHAMHFHQTGKCDAPDFKSSGGHYNPEGSSHGHKTQDGPHAGDMMNVNVASDRTGTFIVTNEQVSINGDHGLPALLDADGTALILHAGADDYQSQPSGAAGARIGCAIVGG